MIDIISLNLHHAILTLTDFDYKDVTLYKNTLFNSEVMLLKLIWEIQPQEKNYTKLQNYFYNILREYFPELSFNEKLWYTFYLTIFSYKGEYQGNEKLIYNKFTELPQINTNNSLIKYIQYLTYSLMIDIYLTLKIPKEQGYELFNKINNCPDEIKHYGDNFG